jgi:hypothetical protein
MLGPTSRACPFIGSVIPLLTHHGLFSLLYTSMLIDTAVSRTSTSGPDVLTHQQLAIRAVVGVQVLDVVPSKHG